MFAHIRDLQDLRELTLSSNVGILMLVALQKCYKI